MYLPTFKTYYKQLSKEDMGEDFLVLVLKLARVNEDRNRLGIDDYAVLQCVSKGVAKEAKDIIDNNDCMQKAWRNTAFFLGFDSDFAIKTLNGGEHLPHCRSDMKYAKKHTTGKIKELLSINDELVVDAKIVISMFIKTRRLLYTLETRKPSKGKLVQLLNELTSKIAQDTFSLPATFTISSQSKTIRSLMNLLDSRLIEMRVLACFFTFYFISLCLKIKNKQDSILNNQGFRNTVIAKVASIKVDLRNQITLIPYGFTEKLFRALTLLGNSLKKW